MRRTLSYLGACALAALAPLYSRGEAPVAGLEDFPGWPRELEGRALHEQPIEGPERAFIEDFPGRIGRFSDGERDWVLRWLPAPTRRLHSLAQCYRALGFTIDPLPMERGPGSELWSCFLARKGSERYHVRERIHDDAGGSWTDISSWYWSVATGGGPWWAVAVVTIPA